MSVHPYVCPYVTRYFLFLKKRVIGYSSGACVCVCACVRACLCVSVCTHDEDASIVCLPNLFLLMLFCRFSFVVVVVDDDD